MRVKRLPTILALHLKRFKYMEQYNRHIKVSHRVVFPLELRLFNTVSTSWVRAPDPERRIVKNDSADFYMLNCTCTRIIWDRKFYTKIIIRKLGRGEIGVAHLPSNFNISLRLIPNLLYLI